MKKDGKYRFSLQFGSDSEKQVRAGEFLERLGKKKSIVVVEALNDYLLAHPELQEAHGRKIEVNVSGGYDRHKIEQIIRSIVEEKIAGLCVPDVLVANSQPIDSKATVSQKELPETMEDDIGQMLDNLDFFQLLIDGFSKV